MRITRREFLQYCTASAAALGLSQLDLLKLEKALAADVCKCDDAGAAHVIWFQGQSCGGCTLSILNRMRSDYGSGWHPEWIRTALDGPTGAVQDIVDLLVGDAVNQVALGNPGPRAGWATFPNGYISLDYQSEVMAGAGDLIADYIECLRNDGTKYYVGLSGSIPLLDHHYPVTKGQAPWQNFCTSGSFNTGDLWGLGGGRRECSIGEIIHWLATGSGFSGLVAFGTCASYGGVPSARGNWTAASGAYNFLVNYLPTKYPSLTDLSGAIINVPGCPPHPDWMIYPVAYILLNSALPPLDTRYFNDYVWMRNKCVWAPHSSRNTPSDIYTINKGYQVFCEACEKYTTTEFQCWDLGAGPGVGDYTQEKEWCTRPVGCNGYVATPDCPTRRWNNFDDNTHNSWCVGANYVCQGCAEPDFPDGRSPFFSGDKYYG